MITFRTLQLVTAALLMWALANNPYDYYVLLRFVVCPVSAYGAYRATQLNKHGWAWVLGIIAVVFNPIINVHLERETWEILNVLASLVLAVSMFTLTAKNLTARDKLVAFMIALLFAAGDAVVYFGCGSGSVADESRFSGSR